VERGPVLILEGSGERIGAIDSPDLPAELAQLHRSLARGARLELRLSVPRLREVPDALETVGSRLEGAGFDRIQARRDGRSQTLRILARRAFTLPDWVAPELCLLVCGLNPSLYAAETGIPFGRPGNRFWPAARTAGLVKRDRDPLDALRHGVGFTDLAKRATARAAELRSDEYARGLARVGRLVEAFAPSVICFVGLDGWRRAVDRRATPGWIPGGLEGRPAYLMPSTSGLNARTRLPDLVDHLRRVRPRRSLGSRS
jgi:TDG/mug DNA glycosylase family protein